LVIHRLRQFHGTYMSVLLCECAFRCVCLQMGVVKNSFADKVLRWVIGFDLLIPIPSQSVN